MIFDENGNLFPSEIIETDLQTIEKVFVEEMPFSATRRTLFANFLEYNALLKSILSTSCVQWIDGSFATMKRNPQDIDVITFVDFQDYERSSIELEKLKQWRFDKNKGIDGYMIKVYPPNTPSAKLYENDRQQWAFLFHSIKKSKQFKGFLQIKL